MKTTYRQKVLLHHVCVCVYVCLLCVCVDVCVFVLYTGYIGSLTWTWRLSVHNSASLATNLPTRSLSHPLMCQNYRQAVTSTWQLCGPWRSELWYSCFRGKCFNHGAVSPAPQLLLLWFLGKRGWINPHCVTCVHICLGCLQSYPTELWNSSFYWRCSEAFRRERVTLKWFSANLLDTNEARNCHVMSTNHWPYIHICVYINHLWLWAKNTSGYLSHIRNVFRSCVDKIILRPVCWKEGETPWNNFPWPYSSSLRRWIDSLFFKFFPTLSEELADSILQQI